MATFEHLDTDMISSEEGIRQIVGKKSMDELVSSIKKYGIIQPIVVQNLNNGRYKLLVGSRRLVAARIIGLDKVPTIILEKSLGADETIAVMLVENLQRENLDPIDEAEAYALLKKMGTRVSAIARLVGKERSYVSHSLRLLKLHSKVREAVRQLNIPKEHALALLRLDGEQQLLVANEIFENNLTMRETRDRVRALLGKELQWRLIPVRVEPDKYEKLVQIAPDGDVEKLMKSTVDQLISDGYN